MNALALGLVAALCWGIHDFCVRFISQKVPITTCILSVLMAGLIFLSGLMLATQSYEPLPRTAIWPVMATGIAFTVANLGLYGAFQRGPVWLAAPLVACFSVFSVGLSVWAGASVSLAQWGAVLVVLFGISMISVLADEAPADTPPMGITIIYALIAALAFALTFKFGQLAAKLSNEMMSSLISRIVAIGAVICLIVALRQPLWPGREALPVLAAMGVVDGIAILSVVSAGGLPDAQNAAVTTSMYGLPAIWLASTFLGERINPKQWIGCFIAFAGVGYLSL